MKYRNITYEQLLEDFKNRLASDPKYANISSASIYHMFMEMLCACMDMTNYYMQRTAEEGFIDTARLDSSIIKHGKNLGYNPRRRIPAQCDLQIVIKGPLPSQLMAGDSVVFNQEAVKLNFANREYILNASYGYTFTNDDLVGKNNSSWKKTLTYAVPSENVTYLPLQGKSFYAKNNLSKISCFQGVKKVEVIHGDANLGKIGKVNQFYDINNIKFSNWYGKRDPFAFYKNNYTPKLSWCKVGIGASEEEALKKSNLFQIEDTSIYLNEDIQALEITPNEPLKVCLLETNYDKTIRLRFGNDNHLCSPGLIKMNDNIYVQYIETDGNEANKIGATGHIMTCSNSFYLQHKGEVIDISNNIQFIINSDIYGGEAFESQESIKINAPAYFSSRNKLITKPDFVSYFRSLSTPVKTQTALVFGQQEIENSGNNILKYMQNYVFYSLIGHMYSKNNGNYYPRNVLTDKDDIDDPFSIYADDYVNHIPDYIKMVKSFESYYNTQYDDEPEDQWLKNIKIIRDNCQARMEINSRILSLPPIVQYYDLVGNVKVKPLTHLQNYKTEIENKIYEYLDNRNGSTQKIYKSDLIKFFNENEDTIAVDIDLKVSDIIKSSAEQFSWENGMLTGRTSNYGNSYVPPGDPLLQSAQHLNKGSTYQEIKLSNGNHDWFNTIRVSAYDLYNKNIDPERLVNRRVNIVLNNLYYADYNAYSAGNVNNLRMVQEEYTVYINAVNTVSNTLNENDTTTYYELVFDTIESFSGNFYYACKAVSIAVPNESDFYSTSTFSTAKTIEYKLSMNQISAIETRLKNWLKNGAEINEADRAIDLPYTVKTYETVTREETYMRKGYNQSSYNVTISEKAFWMYFIPSILSTYYKNKITEDSDINSAYWQAASKLILDLYALCKPGFCDNILDANNNIVNFSMDNEVAVIRCNIAYGYNTMD